MKTYLVLIMIFLTAGLLNAQSERCGTIPTQEEITYLNRNQTNKETFSYRYLTSVIEIPIANHIVRTSNGDGGLSTQELATAIQNLNAFYAQANIQFIECEPVKFIDNSNWYDLVTSDDFNVYETNNVRNVLNIYYFNSINAGGFPLCGYTNFPPGPDRIMMANSCTVSGTTLIHEIGHYLSLYHTHGTSNCGTTDELVDKSNCSVAGDRLCDTPADPNLYRNCATSLVDYNCVYTGTLTDVKGQAYNPQTNNIMSYGRASCKSIFTQQQFDRVVYSALNDRDYLSCNSSISCSTLISSFPYTEGFESGLGGWIQDTRDDINWTRNGNGTPSVDTGPASAAEGSYYMFTEASNPNYPGKVANLVSPCFDLSSVNNPELTFKYHMYGASMGTLRVQISVNKGSSWTTFLTRTCNQGNLWQTINLSLNSYTTQTALMIRFNGTTGTGYNSDIAVDSVSLAGECPNK